MLSNLNKALALALAVAVLGGCATSKEKLLPHGDSTMMDIWQQNAGDGVVAPARWRAGNCSMHARACAGR